MFSCLVNSILSNPWKFLSCPSPWGFCSQQFVQLSRQGVLRTIQTEAGPAAGSIWEILSTEQMWDQKENLSVLKSMGILPSLEMVRSRHSRSASPTHFGISDNVFSFSEGKGAWKLSEKKKSGSWVSYSAWRKLHSLVVFQRQPFKETPSTDLRNVSAQAVTWQQFWTCQQPRLTPAQHRGRGPGSGQAGVGQQVQGKCNNL